MKRGHQEVGVMIGQVWADNDARSEGRRIKVVGIGPNHVECRVVRDSLHARRSSVTNEVRIRIKRLRPNSTGYYYVSGPTMTAVGPDD